MSTNIINGIIPKLNPNLKFSKFDNEYHIVESHKHQLKIKNEFFHLIRFVDGRSNLGQITLSYNLRYGKKLTEEQIWEIFRKQLFPYGVLESDSPIIEKKREIHLRLSFIFWKGQSLNFVSTILGKLYDPIFFYVTFSFALFFNIVCFWLSYSFSFSSLKPDDVFLFAIFSFLILILHELGHVSACTKFNTENNGIGFGFYIISPVFFADISGVWHLPKNKRLIVNLAGIYMELLVSTSIFVYFIITKNTNLLASVYAILIHVLLNLNPFLKYDGYWIVSDLFGFSNLRLQSNNKFKVLLNFRKIRSINSKDLLLAIYSLISNILILTFLFYIILYRLEEILGFPYKVYRTLSNCSSLLHVEYFHLFKRLINQSIPFLFYFILIKYVYGLTKKHLYKIRIPVAEKAQVK